MAGSFSTFPSDKKDALALLYVQNQDLTGKSPEDVVAMYNDAYIRISEKLKNLAKENKQHETPYRSILN